MNEKKEDDCGFVYRKKNERRVLDHAYALGRKDLIVTFMLQLC